MPAMQVHGDCAWRKNVHRRMWLSQAGGGPEDRVTSLLQDFAAGAGDTAKNVDRDKAKGTLQGKDAGKARDAAKNVDRDKAQSTLQSRDAGKSRDVAKSRDLASKPARSRDSALAGAGVGNLNAAPAEQHGQPATRGGSARLPRRPGGMWRH